MTADEVSPLALLIRALDLTEAILTAHTADAGGDCASCSGQLRTVPWPCSLVYLANEAASLDEVP